MIKVELERRDESRLLMTIWEEGSSRRILKILGDSQIPQLLQMSEDLLPERALFPSAQERNFVDNNEYDLTKTGELYRLQLRNGVTSYDQFYFTDTEFRQFIEVLREIREDELFIRSTQLGPPITSDVPGLPGPTGPMGSMGPIGPAGDENSYSVNMWDDIGISDTTLINLDELSFLIADGENVLFLIFIFIEATNVDPGIKVAINGPPDVAEFTAGFLLPDNVDGTIGPNGPEGLRIDSIGSYVTHLFGYSGGTGPVSTFMQITGHVRASSTGGRIVVQVAQAVASTTPLLIGKGSHILYRIADQ